MIRENGVPCGQHAESVRMCVLSTDDWFPPQQPQSRHYTFRALLSSRQEDRPVLITATFSADESLCRPVPFRPVVDTVFGHGTAVRSVLLARPLSAGAAAVSDSTGCCASTSTPNPNTSDSRVVALSLPRIVKVVRQRRSARLRVSIFTTGIEIHSNTIAEPPAEQNAGQAAFCTRKERPQ